MHRPELATVPLGLRTNASPFWAILLLVSGGLEHQTIEQEFGDGIMSAIDFDMVMERLPDPNGDWVKITMSEKFLPFKFYGATRNTLAHGLKEE